MAKQNHAGLPATIQEAKQSGLKRYFTGQPCSHGHIAPRLVSGRCCVECARVRQAEMRAFNKEHRPERCDQVRKRRRAYAQREKELYYGRIGTEPLRWSRVILRGLRYRSQKTGLPVSIKPEDIPVPRRCPVFGTPIAMPTGERGLLNPNSPSVDRIDNDKGYVCGNVAVISLRANLLKKDATLAEMRALLRYMEEHLGNAKKRREPRLLGDPRQTALPV